MYDVATRKPAILELPRELSEVSGLAMTSDGRLFAHNDEVGIIYQIDYTTGVILKRFSIGEHTLRGDFEDITIVEDKFFLISSNGRLYTFSEGRDGEHVKYEVFQTGLSSINNVEGLCYDPETHSLLLGCKDFPGKGFSRSRAIYSFSLNTMKLEKKPRFMISLRELKRRFGLEDFKPSGIARNPKTGALFILSVHEPAILEVSPEGEVLGYARLPKIVHQQPEGIAFAPDLTLLIGNEGTKRGRLVKYPLAH